MSQTICGTCNKSFDGLYAYLPRHFPCVGRAPWIIPIAEAPAITNVDQLPRGVGARFLECTRAHRAELPLIAVRWRRTVPKKFEILIDFTRDAEAQS